MFSRSKTPCIPMLACNCRIFMSISCPSIDDCDEGCFKAWSWQSCYRGWKNWRAWNVPHSTLRGIKSCCTRTNIEVTRIRSSSTWWGCGALLASTVIKAPWCWVHDLVIFDVTMVLHIWYMVRSRKRLMCHEKKIGDLNLQWSHDNFSLKKGMHKRLTTSLFCLGTRDIWWSDGMKLTCNGSVF